MIEFDIHYWEPAPVNSGAQVSVAFRASGVDVSVVSVASISDAGWDSARTQIGSQAHADWSAVYARTPLARELTHEKLNSATMLAVAALHVLVPASAAARQLESGSSSALAAAYPRGLVSDGLGNVLRVLAPLVPNQRGAADELFRLGLLQRLRVTLSSSGAPVVFERYFAPFHAPGVATSDLSSAALALKALIP